ncbi:hypothetical protein LCGC14_1759810 [marine sediment metagenome]|uniref:Uncharacterized protein n=1 Tax=marine sediment metagenome TaxID=412755 RepID=A0A0F9HNQ8_9ZZZZ
MANPAVLERLLGKLVRINAMIGSPALDTVQQDIATVDALIVVADGVIDTLASEIGAGTAVSIAADIAVTQATLDAVGA